jgi:toxin ParE1/3/4
MASLRIDGEAAQDLARIAAHLSLHEVQDIDERIADIFDALQLLLRHPLIGRPVDGVRRDLVIGSGHRGYVARYRFDELDDTVIVLGLRAQREMGFEDR